MNYSTEVVKQVNYFIDNFLSDEKWFKSLIVENAYDLIFVSGSALSGKSDSYSDIDIFLVCSIANQKKFNLQPVYVYEYQNKIFEISMFATEKLLVSAKNKDDVFRWTESMIIRSINDDMTNIFHDASKLSNTEKRDRLWSSYVFMQINSYDIIKQFKRTDYVSCMMLLSDNITSLFDSLLSEKNLYVSHKQMSKNIKDIAPLVHEKVSYFYKDIVNSNISEINDYLIGNMQDVLMREGFSSAEIDNWDKVNLTMINFQKQ